MSTALDVARPFIGVARYVWAAENPTGNPPSFDCSGLTRYAYRTAYGVKLPHNSAAQSAVGTAVSEADAQPNDLVFFTTAGVVHHVGIVSGPGRMVAAQNPSEGVREASIKGDGRPYHFRKFAGVPRSAVSGTKPPASAGSPAAGSGSGNFNWNPINDVQHAGSLAAGAVGGAVTDTATAVVSQLGRLLIVGIAVTAGAGLLLLGIFKASGEDQKIQQATAQVTDLAGLAAL